MSKNYTYRHLILPGLLALVLFSPVVMASKRSVDLVVDYKTVNFAGQTRKALAVNDQIPGPTLHFKEGDEVRIRVLNQLAEPTTIHWHGLLVPWQMDGIEGISQSGIPPKGSYRYRFTLKQAGTYWYHAHAGLQEQQGLYGALIIDPSQPPRYHYTRDFPVVLSDWSNTHPEQILANLKKDGDYYSPRFPLQPSLVKFIHDYRKASPEERENLLADYKMMQQMRMGLYDLSDVAYDAYLLNGRPKATPWTARVKVGDIVRLRFIGAGGSTIFHVKIPGTSMQLVQVDGNDVRPHPVQDFTLAPGETFDVLVKIQENKSYLIYAESNDKVGAIYGALVTAPEQEPSFKTITPFPEPLPVTRELMSMLMSDRQQGISSNDPGMRMAMLMGHSMQGDHPGEQGMQMTMPMGHSMHGGSPGKHRMQMTMPTEPLVHGDSFSAPAPPLGTAGGKYQNLVASNKTNDPTKPVTSTIHMELFGYMGQYIWMINGLPEYKAKPIILEPAKRYRFVFTNTSMMHHPMHLHGHWFILRKGEGAHDPLLHTIDVAPGATVTADVDTDASGQWFFHCHLLYHMITGMARVFQYSTLIEITRNEAKPQNIDQSGPYKNRPIVRVDELEPINHSLVQHPSAHPGHFWFASLLDASWDPFQQVQRLTYKGLYGPDYNKLQLFLNEGEVSQGSVINADLDIFYWRQIRENWALKGGVNYIYRPANTPYWQPGLGFEGVMPYFIATDVRSYYRSGSFKLDVELSRDTQITNNFFLKLGVRGIAATKTVKTAVIGSGLNQWRVVLRPYYRLMPGLNLFAEYEHEQDCGVFDSLQSGEGQSSVQNTLSFGLSLLF